MLDLSKFPSYMEVNNEIIDEYRQDDTLDQLKQINEKFGDGERWCSWEKNLDEIVKNAGVYPGIVLKAIHLYTRHAVLSAKYDVIRNVWVTIEKDTDTEEAEA